MVALVTNYLIDFIALFSLSLDHKPYQQCLRGHWDAEQYQI